MARHTATPPSTQGLVPESATTKPTSATITSRPARGWAAGETFAAEEPGSNSPWPTLSSQSRNPRRRTHACTSPAPRDQATNIAAVSHRAAAVPA
ncbi:MAG: hypothetical protein KKA97_02525, partial [Actinobacteria bacterium]|nr:hypothetical protein [Actinomycetota bacterium]